MTVYVPGPLRSYTKQANTVEATGATLAELLSDLDRRYPGIRFRMIDEQDNVRRHIKLFVNQQQKPGIETPLQEGDEIHIICALSGGSGLQQ